MLSSDLINDLSKLVQSESSAALWSQGVALTREGVQFVPLSLDDKESVIILKIPGQALSPKVTLWLKDQEWDCNCNGPSPCQHVAAAMIALKRGLVSESLSQDKTLSTSSSAVATLEYRFVSHAQGTRFERYIVSGETKSTLSVPLVSYQAGLQSGRLQGLPLVTSKEDFHVDQALVNYHGDLLDRPRLEALFAALNSDQKIFFDEKWVAVSNNRILVHFECIDEAEGYRIRRKKNPYVTKQLLHGLVVCGDTLHLLAPTRLSPDERKMLEGEGTYFGPQEEIRFCTRIVPALQEKVFVEVNSLKIPKLLDMEPRVELLCEKIQGAGNISELSVCARLVYGEPAIALVNGTNLQLKAFSGSERKAPLIRRQLEKERNLLKKLSVDLNLQIDRPIRLSGEAAINFTKQASDWNIQGKGLEYFSTSSRELQPVIKAFSGETLSLELGFALAGTNEKANVDFIKVFKAWQAKQEGVCLLDGTWAKIPTDWMQKNAQKIVDFIVTRDSLKDLPSSSKAELSQLIYDVGGEAPLNLIKIRENLDNFERIPNYDLPQDLNAQLRDYQLEGVKWLNFLREQEWGALLADDMGLGKTLQTLCAVQGKSLIVAPTSVLTNWEKEIVKFRPTLKIAKFYGTQRILNTNADIVLTTYGILRLDQEILCNTQWDSIVLDEAQTIKNPDSQVARAAFRLKAKFKIALSGTPIENKLDDLWSLFNFLNPGLLGTQDMFQEKIAKPLQSGETNAVQRLYRKIKPFILRRLKKDVAKELPARTENILKCELSEHERNLYQTVMAAGRSVVAAEQGHGGEKIKEKIDVMQALELILRLRQTCCHSSLVNPATELVSSSKIELLMESIVEALAGGHKCLVFSQWTKFLGFIELALKEKSIAWSRIDGSTTQRQRLVDEFQGPSGPPIMLISLKAGGVGLNLTAADHVYICDPWWNPAAEDQAADRAHRIGQTNPVFIHKLVAADTIEEKIIELQEQKRDLVKAVLSEGGGALALSQEDLRYLLG